MNNINDNDIDIDNLVEIYCDITNQIKNTEPEAFNLICLLKGNRIAYLLKSSQKSTQIFIIQKLYSST